MHLFDDEFKSSTIDTKMSGTKQIRLETERKASVYKIQQMSELNQEGRSVLSHH